MDNNVIDKYIEYLASAPFEELVKIIMESFSEECGNVIYEHALFESEPGKELLCAYIALLNKTKCISYDFPRALNNKVPPSDEARFIFETNGLLKNEFTAKEGSIPLVPLEGLINKYIFGILDTIYINCAFNASQKKELVSWILYRLYCNNLYEATKYRLSRAMAKEQETDYFKKTKKKVRGNVAQKKLKLIFNEYSDVLTDEMVTNAWKDYTIDMVMET